MGSYQVFCSRQRYMELRGEPAFWKMVTFSHVLNSLRACVLGTVVEDREKARLLPGLPTNRFLATAATLHEGLAFANSLGRHFRDLPAYERFASFANSKEVSDLEREVLAPVRNKVTFHFDDDVAEIAQGRAPWSNIVFEEGWESWEGENRIPNYAFGSIIVLYSIIGGDCDLPGFADAFARALTRTYEAATNYLELGDTLMRGIFQLFGFQRRPIPEGPVKW